MCEIYKALDGTCESVIGPLQEDQSFIPVELHWPDGAPNLMERLTNVQTLLFRDTPHDSGAQNDIKIADSFSIARAAQQISNDNGLKDKVDAMEAKIDGIKGDVDTMKGKIDAVEEDINTMKDKVNAVEGKVDKVHDEMKDLKEMLSDIIAMLAKNS